jgi:hypothetical protein
MNRAEKGNSAELRRQLLALIEHFEPGKSKDEQHESLGELLTIARGYQLPPVQWMELIVTLSGKAGDTSLTSESVAELCRAVADWRTNLRPVPVRPEGEKPCPVRTTKPEKSPPTIAPRPPGFKAWRDAAIEIREQLLPNAGRGWFQEWMMPQHQWRSGWSEAHLLVSAKDSEDREAVVVVPTELAASSNDAQKWWQRKIAAASGLKGIQAGQGCWAKVLKTGPAEDPSFIMLEREVAGESLLEAVARNSVPALRDRVDVAIALCTILERAADHGVNVLDLPPEAVRLELRPGLRMIRLAEATLVIPVDHLLPEWKLGGEPRPDTTRGVGRSQVFLVAAVLLTFLRGDLRSLRADGTTVVGRSASLALLAGRPQWSNHEADTITESVVYELEKKPGGGVAIRELVDVLRWSLAEQPDQRYVSLRELATALKKCLR